MRKFKSVWCFIDGKKHCDVIQWALAVNVDMMTAKEMLAAQYPYMNVMFKTL